MSNTCAICTHRFTVSDPLHGDVDCLELRPDQGGNLPVCLFLFGGGGSGDSLQAMAAPLSAWWGGGVVAPCRVVTAAVAPWGFYLDDRARGMGWEIAAAEAGEGRIEATDTTAWWGFKDDVVIRITAEGEGSRLDIRSMSRVGKSDIGKNAERIRKCLAALKDAK